MGRLGEGQFQPVEFWWLLDGEQLGCTVKGDQPGGDWEAERKLNVRHSPPRHPHPKPGITPHKSNRAGPPYLVQGPAGSESPEVSLLPLSPSGGGSHALPPPRWHLHPRS
jgi:hypothetical protein